MAAKLALLGGAVPASPLRRAFALLFRRRLFSLGDGRWSCGTLGRRHFNLGGNGGSFCHHWERYVALGRQLK